MKAKTLLIAAATLAAGILSTQAAVYSQNIVGYYNLPIGAGQYALFANQLVNGDDVNKTNNSINSMFSGLVSDQNQVNNTVLYKWNGNGYNIWQYYSGADVDALLETTGSPSGFYTADLTFQSGSIPPGSGSFLYNPSGSALTATLVGSVSTTTNVIQITPGFNIYSLGAPVSTNLESAVSFANFPGTSDQNQINNDVLYKWNGNGYNIWQYYTGADVDALLETTGSPTGFYTADLTLQNSKMDVGSAFFLYHAVNTTVNWTNVFIVQ